MQKYLIEVNYVGEGISGLLKEGGTGRQSAVEQLFRSMGGTLEAFYFAFGDKDVFIIGDLPDHATATALVLRVNASGAALCKTTVLIKPEEVDAAVKKTVAYRPPGYEIDPNEVSKWDNEGGHLSRDWSGDESRV
jgi:uncharacterized protein with GYD domain